jgi:hypothetical protein
VTGRGWNPSSSLATSKLVEKLKFLLDSEARDSETGAVFVPHILALKIQWNKFSSDAEEELEKLSTELHAATINHINDRLYHTYAPIRIDVKTDYFTEGVRLTGSFGEFSEDGEDEAAVNVTLPQIKIETTPDGTRMSVDLENLPAAEPEQPVYTLTFTVNGKTFEKALDFAKSKRFSIGRVKENEVSIDHTSVSKVHASLVLNSEGKLLVADTGSTNGTFVDGKRIAYGKAIEIKSGSALMFGTVNVELKSKFVPVPVVIGDATEAFSTDGKTIAGLPEESDGLTPYDPGRVGSDSVGATPLPTVSSESPLIESTSSNTSDWADFGTKSASPIAPPADSAAIDGAEQAEAEQWDEIGEEDGTSETASRDEQKIKEDWEI